MLPRSHHTRLADLVNQPLLSTRLGPRSPLSRAAWGLIVIGMLWLGSTLGFTPTPAHAQTDQPTVTETHIITPHDSIPRLCTAPTVIAHSSGAWSNPTTWSTNQIPAAEARVSIPSNISVTYDQHSDVEIDCIEIAENGVLHWSTNQSTRLRITHLQVLPHGTLTIGSVTAPIASEYQAEVIIRDVPLDVTSQDPAQYGNGIQVFGTIQIHGAAMDRTFVRFAQETPATGSSLELAQVPAGWQSGDRLLVPDTRQIPFRKNLKFVSQAEEPTVSDIVGASVIVNTPLQFDHLGPRDANGQVGAIEQGMLPHVGNLTRNVVLRSARLAETAKAAYCMGAQNVNEAFSCVTRGHVILLHRATVDLRYAHFENLGRTTNESLNNTSIDVNGNVTAIGLNQVGRYSIHLHHVMGPANPANTGHQFTLLGNVIEGFLKWAIAIHDSHYGLIKDNIAYDGQGAAIVMVWLWQVLSLRVSNVTGKRTVRQPRPGLRLSALRGWSFLRMDQALILHQRLRVMCILFPPIHLLQARLQ